jgi:tetratricopeptide (TPR) repeat protein
LIRYCEEILKNNPDHPAALHYHIHLVEASLHPEAALASADRLKDLMPGVPHMVHMASHSYQRTGLYAKGVVINDSANAAQRNFSTLAPQLHLGTDVIHYNAVEAFCAMNGAMYHKAIQSAQKCRDVLTSRGGSLGFNGQYLSTMPLFVMVRLGKWSELLDQPVPDTHWIYARIISDFARGLAYVHLGKIDQAQACLEILVSESKDPALEVRTLPYNAPIKGTRVAEGILEGEILFAQGKSEAAMVAFHRAIIAENGLSYLEPNDWPVPARHFAGYCLLRLGRAAEAEKIYREDLVQNPGNGWSLMGLAQSLKAQHNGDAADYRAKAQAAFAGADAMPTASVY